MERFSLSPPSNFSSVLLCLLASQHFFTLSPTGVGGRFALFFGAAGASSSSGTIIMMGEDLGRAVCRIILLESGDKADRRPVLVERGSAPSAPAALLPAAVVPRASPSTSQPSEDPLALPAVCLLPSAVTRLSSAVIREPSAEMEPSD